MIPLCLLLLCLLLLCTLLLEELAAVLHVPERLFLVEILTLCRTRASDTMPL